MGLADAISNLVEQFGRFVDDLMFRVTKSLISLGRAIDAWVDAFIGDFVVRYLTEWAPWRESEIRLSHGGHIRVRYTKPGDHDITANKLPGVNLGD